MSLKSPIYHEFNLDALKGESKPIRITHIDDTNVDVLELCVRQGGSKIDLTGATVTARIVLHDKRDYLINDNVQCTVNDSGNVLIPFDNAVIESQKGVLKIEVNIRRAEDVLTLQFPLFVFVNDTILADAEITPESKGTIPKLLEEVKAELERVEGYVDEEQVKDIIDGVLSGITTNIPTLLIDNTVNQQYNPDGHLLWYYIDSDGTRHNLFDFTPYIGGTDNYNSLKNKPSINNVELDGNKTAEDLGLQSKIDNYFTSNNSSYIRYDFNSIPNAYASKNSCMYRIYRSNIQNFPQDLADVFSSNGIIYIFHYIHSLYGANYLIRKIAGYSVNNQYIEFAQFCTVIEGGSITSASPWQELTGGGSQIVSGVVNQNGTITFTDSDGNTFTTSGSSVIGDDGFSPTATVTQTASGATVSITDKNGTTTANISNGADGQDYVLTSQDKTDIANIVLQLLPTTQGVLYGNTSN